MALKTRKISKKDVTTIEGKNRSTRGNVCLPCEGTEKKQPSICSSHSGHSLGNNIGDLRSNDLSV